MPEYSLAVWHGFNAPLVMSLDRDRRAASPLYVLLRQAAARGFLRPPLFRGSRASACSSARSSLSRAARARRARLARHAAAAAADVCMVVVIALLRRRSLRCGTAASTWGDRPRVPASLEFMALWAIGMVCAVGAAWQAKFHRLAALTMLAVTGLVTCLTFVWFSAPDLALTQLAVEVVTTVLFLLGLRWLPKRVDADDPRIAARAHDAPRARPACSRSAAGAGLAALSYAMLTRPAPQSISPFFLERALPEGGGTNVVNVMLVDFRGFDTLGEITVLARGGAHRVRAAAPLPAAAESADLPAQQRGDGARGDRPRRASCARRCANWAT